MNFSLEFEFNPGGDLGFDVYLEYDDAGRIMFIEIAEDVMSLVTYDFKRKRNTIPSKLRVNIADLYKKLCPDEYNDLLQRAADEIEKDILYRRDCQWGLK